MSNTVQYSNDQFLNMISIIIKITIMFLSTTKIIKVTLFSLIAGLILQCGFNFIKVTEFQYEWIDIQFVILTLLTLFMLAQINLIFKIISDRIYENFESLKTIIKEKDRKIHILNKEIAELNEKLVNKKLVNEKLVNKKLVNEK